MLDPDSTIVVSDTSVLINFLRINRTDLIAVLPYDFLATNHVAEEITASYQQQTERYERAIADGIIIEVELVNEVELETFAALTSTGRLGIGECSAIACAICREHALAIDDKRAANQAREDGEDLVIVRTEDLVVDLIEIGVLTVEEADTIKSDWSQNHRFTLRFGSFAELLQ